MDREKLQAEILALRRKLEEKEADLRELEEVEEELEKRRKIDGTNGCEAVNGTRAGAGFGRESERPRFPLVAEEYRRYGRQMILPEIGLRGM
jgi:adenylyltransferase/sulfurtransferase